MRLAMSYGTLLQQGRLRHHQPGRPPGQPRAQAGHDRRPQRHRHLGARPAGRAGMPSTASTSRAATRPEGIHVRISPDDPEEVEILFAEPPGVPIDVSTERKIENYFHREDFRRAFSDEMGAITYPPRLVESYLGSLVEAWDGDSIRRRAPASGHRLLVLARVAPPGSGPGQVGRRGDDHQRLRRRVAHLPHPRAAARSRSRRSAGWWPRWGPIWASSSTLPPSICSSSTRRARRWPTRCCCCCSCATSADRSAPGRSRCRPSSRATPRRWPRRAECSVRRTRSDDAALMAEATAPDVIFAATLGGGYVFPDFVASMDATFTLGKVLELWSQREGYRCRSWRRGCLGSTRRTGRCRAPGTSREPSCDAWSKRSSTSRCPWSTASMVTVDETRWVQILPDADDPVFHLYAEGPGPDDAAALIETYRRRLEVVIEERRSAEE